MEHAGGVEGDVLRASDEPAAGLRTIQLRETVELFVWCIQQRRLISLAGDFTSLLRQETIHLKKNYDRAVKLFCFVHVTQYNCRVKVKRVLRKVELPSTRCCVPYIHHTLVSKNQLDFVSKSSTVYY